MASESLTDALRETLALFDGPGEPRTTPEVAERLGLGRRSTYARLERLVEHGRLETKKVGANARVWWRPPAEVGADEGREPSRNAGATAQKRSTTAESLVEDVLDDVEVGLLVLDEHLEAAWINAAAERYFGLDRRQVLGGDERRLVEEHLTPVVEDGDAFSETVLTAYDDDAYVEGFECHVTAGDDREERWLEHHSKPIDSGALAGGRIECYYDVTDRREGEDELRRQRNFTERILETAPVGVLTVEEDGTFTTANRRATELLELERESDGSYAVGVNDVYDDGGFLPPAERPYVEAFETGKPVRNWHAQLELSNGGRRWLSTNVEPILDEDGDVERVLVTVEDVSQLKELAARLERQRDELEGELDEILGRITDAFYALDDEWRFTHVNERAEELIDFEGEGLVGKHAWETFEWAADSKLREEYERAMETQESTSFELYYPDPLDGWYEIHAYPSETGLSVYFRDVTERKETEKALRKSEERLRLALEAADLGAWELDLRTGESPVRSPQHDRIFGYEEPLDDWNVERFLEHVHPDDREDVERSFDEALGAGEWTFECRIVRADGAERWIAAHGELYFDDGEPVRAVGVVRDVTGRKERERRLERYVGIVDAIGEPVYELDAEGRFVFVNDAFVDHSGYEESELLGEHVSIRMDDEVIARIESRMKDLLTADEDHKATVEYDVVSRSGERIPVENRFTLLTDDEGRVQGSAGILQDISERLERERALKKSERRYRTLVENFPDGAVGLFDEDFRYTAIGGELLEQLDIPSDEAVGESIYERYPDELVEEIEPHFQAALDGEARSVEVEYLGRDLYARMLPVEDEEVFSGMLVVRDVTERKRRECELERQREQLAALNDLNAIVSDITETVIEQSTREEIEQAVCDALAAADAYEFAWLADVDPTTNTFEPRATAGTDGYAEEITVSIDPDDPGSRGPGATAVRERETQVVRNVFADPAFEPWRGAATEYGFSAAASIPIVHEETVYGIIAVYADRPNAFDTAERAVVSQLGEVVGHAIAATERKRALMSDDLVELEFRIRDVFAALDVPVETEGTITLDYAVPVGDDEFLVYGTASPESLDVVERLLETRPHWESVTVLSEGEFARFELLLTDPPVLSVVASLGGYVDNVVIEDGDYQMTIHLAPGVDVRRVLDAIEDAYPKPEMLRRRQITRSRDDLRHVQRHLAVDLTDRQRTALDVAYHAGFFEWPRETSGEEVAASLGVAPPTFHQHLRKAERKVFDALLSTPARMPDE